MAGSSSFDVTTGVDYMEVHNAVDQTTKEITQRYDFKGLKVGIELNAKEKKIVLTAPDEYKLTAILRRRFSGVPGRRVSGAACRRCTRTSRTAPSRPGAGGGA